MDIKPIETRYKGYRFRSRLEARWAVFFDALGVEWNYELQGYDLGDSMMYLPDFWLPRQKQFIEVKAPVRAGYRWIPKDRKYHQTIGDPAPMYMLDLTKAHRLAVASGYPVFMLFSDLSALHCDPEGNVTGSNKGWYHDGKHDDGCCEWGECPICGMVAVACHGQHEACKCLCHGALLPPDRPGNWPRCAECSRSNRTGAQCPHRPWMRTFDSVLITKAFTAARSSRFEHGEEGARA